MAYTIVAICVIMLRYDIDDEDDEDQTGYTYLSRAFNISQLSNPTKFTSKLVTAVISLYVVFCCGSAVVVTFLGDKILEGNIFSIILLSILIVIKLILILVIARQPKSSKLLTFSVPLTPLFPAISIFINILLLSHLDVKAWIRFVLWIIIGLLIYCFYGRRNSKMNEEHILITNEIVDEF